MKRNLLILLAIFSVATTFAQNNNRRDTDGDGVIDRRDVDDDNDGIFDRVENRVRKIPMKNWVNRTNVNVYRNNIHFTRCDLGWNNTVNSQPFTSFGFINNYVVSFKAKVSTKAIVGFGIDENGPGKGDVDFGFRFDAGKVSIVKDGQRVTDREFYRFNDDFSIVYENNKLKFFRNNERLKTFNVGSNVSFYLDTSFKGEYGHYRRAKFTNFLINASSGNRDIDGDGIRNSKDLDSDGDGCNDVIEAGFEDPDNDGILGEGTPVVNRWGKVISCDGYWDVNDDYLDPTTQPCDSEVFGITINTENLPSSEFQIISGNTTLENLTSGTSDSEVFVELGVDSGEDKIVLINVEETPSNAALNLRITKSQDDYTIEVFQNGVWLLLSPEFYEISGTRISFLNTDAQRVNPFQLNLVNGVEYNRLAPLSLSIDQIISVEGGSWEINGPNNFSATISPNLQDNNFTWDGTQAQPGIYKFQLQLQGKFFNGQFLIL